MKHTYQLTGMTCNGCKNNAETALNNLKEITKVLDIMYPYDKSGKICGTKL